MVANKTVILNKNSPVPRNSVTLGAWRVAQIPNFHRGVAAWDTVLTSSDASVRNTFAIRKAVTPGARTFMTPKEATALVLVASATPRQLLRHKAAARLWLRDHRITTMPSEMRRPLANLTLA